MAVMTLRLDGLNCSGCVNSLTKRLLAVDGVTDVEVTLVSGGTSSALLTTEGPVDMASVAAAVKAAGKRFAAPL